MAVLLGAGVAAFAGLLAWCGWWGLRFSLAGPSGLRLVVTGELSLPVRLLTSLLEGPSGPFLLAAATLGGVACLGLGSDGSLEGGSRANGSAAPDSATGRALARLGRWRRDLVALSRDAVAWLQELPSRTGGWHVAALAAVVLGGLLLRALHLGAPVSYDEAFTFTHFVARPPALGISRYTYPANHLLDTLLVHGTTDALGTAPWAIRLPAFVAGVGAVPAAYAALDAVGDESEALVAAALLAGAAPAVAYSARARGWAAVLCLGLLLVPLAARIRRRRDRGAWTLLVVLAAAALFTVPAALYPVGAVLAWLALGRRPGLRREVAVAAAVTALLVAWLYQPAAQRTGVPAIVANRFVAPSPVGEFLGALPGFFPELWASWTAGLPAVVAAALGALAALGLVRDVRWLLRDGPGSGRPAPGGVPQRAGASFPLVALGWFLLLLLATRRVPAPRVWLFLLPVFGLWVARGLGVVARALARTADRPGAALRSRLAAPAAALLLLAGVGGPVTATGAVRAATGPDSFRSGREVARALETRMGEGEAVLAYGTAEVVLGYWFRHLGLPRDRINARPDGGEPLYAVVHRAEGQTLADLLTRAAVAGVRRTRAREVARFESATLYLLPPPGGASTGPRGASAPTPAPGPAAASSR